MKLILLEIIFIMLLVFFSCMQSENSIRITYYGHSCFEFNYINQRIVIDPFTPEWFDYKRPAGKFDIGISTHDARDHACFEGLDVTRQYRASGEREEFLLLEKDSTNVIPGKITIKNVTNYCSFRTVPSFHDEFHGEKNGVNGIICFDFGGIRIVHMGDIGHVLEEQQINKIGRVDILMIPVDSYYIIDLEKAWRIVNQLSPRIVIPVHYKTDKSHNKAYGDDLNKFSAMFEQVEKIRENPLTIRENELGNNTRLLLIDYLK